MTNKVINEFNIFEFLIEVSPTNKVEMYKNIKK